MSFLTDENGRKYLIGKNNERVYYHEFNAAQYLVQERAAQQWMREQLDKLMEQFPGGQILPTGQVVDKDGKDVGIWIE